MTEKEIPPKYQTQWNEASEELKEASIELNNASTRYNQAIISRLAIRQTILIEENE